MNDELKKIRQNIDATDERLLELLTERIKLMILVGEIKKKEKLNLRDAKREKDKIELLKRKAGNLGIPEELVVKLWNVLFEESEKIER